VTETLMQPQVSESKPGWPALRLLGTSRLSPGFLPFMKDNTMRGGIGIMSTYFHLFPRFAAVKT